MYSFFLLVGINSMMMQNLTALAAASSSGGNAGIHGLAAGGKFIIVISKIYSHLKCPPLFIHIYLSILSKIRRRMTLEKFLNFS